tara:strand:+ start:515 stop:772 length:258 start_codon:yes stop_codon:yes gene_type:complete
MENGYKFSFKPFSFDSYNDLLMFGIPVLGGWIPYLGFNTEVRYEESVLSEIEVEKKFFVAEWLLRAVIIIYSEKVTVLEDENYGE